MNTPRRTFLKRVLTTGGAIALSAIALPQSVMASWSEKAKKAFDAETVGNASNFLFDSDDVEKVIDGRKVSIKAPDIAENGAVVPIEVTANLERVESIAIFGDENPKPLVAQFNFPDPDNAVGWVKVRIKLARTSKVFAVVKADGKLYKAEREVKVTIGGCGG
jgi:sulfur-oxidizing protein SoxY